MQRVGLEAALRTAGEKHKGPCPGCISRDSILNTIEERIAGLEHELRERNAEYHKLEADYAEQTSRLSYDLDQSRQVTAAMHAGKASADAEKNNMFKRMKSLEVEMESMTKKIMTVLPENTELHNQERLRRAMPPTVGRPATTEGRPRRSPSEYYDIGCDAGGEDLRWAGKPYEDEE